MCTYMKPYKLVCRSLSVSLFVVVVNIRMWIRKTVESEGGDYFVTK